MRFFVKTSCGEDHFGKWLKLSRRVKDVTDRHQDQSRIRLSVEGYDKMECAFHMDRDARLGTIQVFLPQCRTYLKILMIDKNILKVSAITAPPLYT